MVIQEPFSFLIQATVVVEMMIRSHSHPMEVQTIVCGSRARMLPKVGLYELAVFAIDGSVPTLGVPDSAVGVLATADPFDPFYLPGAEFTKTTFS